MSAAPTPTAILAEIARLTAMLPLRLTEHDRDLCDEAAAKLRHAAMSAANREIQDMLDRIRERTRKRMPEMLANAEEIMDAKAMDALAKDAGIEVRP